MLRKVNKFCALFLTATSLTAMTVSLPAQAYRGELKPKDDAVEKENNFRAPSSYHGKAVVLPIGTNFEGRIQSTIGSSASRQGDRFSVQISAPVLANGTDVLIPSGTEIIGEVVEAVSSSSQPRDSTKRYKPLGKLRVQLMSMKMPSGVTLPLVASMSGEVQAGQRGGGAAGLTSRGSSVAYIGSQAGFDAVNPALSNKRDRTGKLAVLGKDAILKDPILGDSGYNEKSGKVIRSLVKKNRDLYIYSGSPITVKLDAPLKITFAAASGQSFDSQSSEESAPVTKRSGKRFAKERPAAAEEQEASGEGPAPKTPTGKSSSAPGSDF